MGGEVTIYIPKISVVASENALLQPNEPIASHPHAFGPLTIVFHDITHNHRIHRTFDRFCGGSRLSGPGATHTHPIYTLHEKAASAAAASVGSSELEAPQEVPLAHENQLAIIADSKREISVEDGSITLVVSEHTLFIRRAAAAAPATHLRINHLIVGVQVLTARVLEIEMAARVPRQPLSIACWPEAQVRAAARADDQRVDANCTREAADTPRHDRLPPVRG